MDFIKMFPEFLRINSVVLKVDLSHNNLMLLTNIQ